MSGGVDSSTTACILMEQGYEVIGLTLKLFKNQDGPSIDAKKIADILKIEHQTVNCEEQFQNQIINYFTTSYLNGQTPSPCIMCNKHLKFGTLFDTAMKLDCDYFATGHYVKMIKQNDEYQMHRPTDLSRDQTYFLWAINKLVLPKLIFPLNSFDSKADVRKLAEKFNLPVAHKPDSQDICFVPNDDYKKFLLSLNKDFSKKGYIIDNKGNNLGEHNGIINYTIGQRKGLGVSAKAPLYVTGIDAKNNQVVVGSHNDLAKNEINISGIQFLSNQTNQDFKTTVKLRSSMQLIPANVHFTSETTAKVILEQPHYGVAPGQACVFYDGSRLLGGSWITL